MIKIQFPYIMLQSSLFSILTYEQWLLLSVQNNINPHFKLWLVR